ncbi:MAG TPA: hypothetical protein QGF95_07040, partial [Candidatus Latescibacteria bacterium]|nr:hypothetical protein [Candidatus Latescibacterota bacterium]
MACMVLHHVSTPAVALEEACRALGDGGELAIVDLARHEDESLRELADLWLGFQPAEMRRWLKGSGFDVEHAETVKSEQDNDETSEIRLITFTGRKPWQQQPPASAAERKRTDTRATAAAKPARTTTK